MKKVLLFGIWASLLLVFACSDDETPLPTPLVSFTIDPAIPEVGVPVMFENLTTNAASYEWDFGGALTSDETSPTVIFETPGNVTVTLRAFTQDGQVDSTSQTINIRQRVVTGYFVNIFPVTDEGEDWDPTEPDSAKFADIVVQLIADNAANLDNAIFEGTFRDISEAPFSRAVGDTGFPTNVTLTNEGWSFALFDLDPGVDPDDPADDELVPMIGVGFNPVTFPVVVKFDDGTGFISIFFADGDNLIDVDISFELQ